MSEAIGIMDSAYFVPRQELLKWVNNTLFLNLQKIEDLGSGAVYCQLLDAAFGQMIPMHKVNWKAKFQYQFIGNLKIFQDGLQKLMISRKIDIQKLSKAKYQDNLQLIQWLKRYIELHGSFKEDYNATGRRNKAQLLESSKLKRALQPISTNKSVILTNEKAGLSKQKVSRKLFQQENIPKEKQKLAKIKAILLGKQDPIQKLNQIEEVVLGKKKVQAEEQEEEVF